MKYKQRKDGEVFEADKAGPGSFRQRIACCDCGLVHDFAFIVEKERLYIAAERNNRATSARRRKHMPESMIGKTVEVGQDEGEPVVGTIASIEGGMARIVVEIPAENLTVPD